MKLTARLKRGRKCEWWILEGGSVKTTIGEVNHEPAGVGGAWTYKSFLHRTLRDHVMLPHADSLDAAIETIKKAIMETQGEKPCASSPS